jgi:N-acetylmuramoyl-L-alanine amidase
MRALYIYVAALILLCPGCGGEAETPVSSIKLPEIVPGTVLRLSEDDPVGYRVVREGGAGPGILLTFPQLGYGNFPRQEVRLAGRVDVGTEVLVNGSPVVIYPTGSFAFLVPLSPDTGEITITARNESGETVYSLPVSRSVSEPKEREFTAFKAPRLGRIIKSHTALQLLPGRVRLLTLAEDTVLKITGREGGYLRVDLDGELTAWVRSGDVELMDTPPAVPFRAGNVEINGPLQQAHFALQTSVPARVNYISPSELEVVFYNTVVDTRTINLGDWEGDCRWSQDRNGRAVFHLRGGLNCYRWSLGWEGDGYRLDWGGHPGREEDTVVYIDPGHGGDQWGAVSPGGVAEKDANLKLAELVASRLKKEGVKVVLSRDSDIAVGLYERIDLARESGADLFLSLHYNSVGEDRDPLSRSGCAVFYYHPPARELAGSIYRSLKDIGLEGSGLRWRSLAVIRPTDLVAVLVEVAFLSHPEDEAKVLDPEFRGKTADAIVKGVLDYLR